MHSSRQTLAWMLQHLTRRANQRHSLIIARSANPPALRHNGLPWRDCGENPYPRLKLHRSPQRMIGCALQNRALPARVPGNIDMNTAPEITMATAIAATDHAKTASAPRITFSSEGYCIDHPNPELGEQLMADELGVADRDAMDGILRQLVKASANAQEPDEVNLAF